MRIAVVHSYYSSGQPSGENTVVDLEIQMLQKRGMEVQVFAQSTDASEALPGYRLRSATRVATGLGANPLSGISAFRPEVIHVHNLFPNYGHRWLARRPCPVVATLHNYRTICSAATLFRDGNRCTECLTRGKTRAVIHGCYRQSRLASVPLWLRHPGPPVSDPFLTEVDHLIMLTARARNLFTSLGIDPARSSVLPNPSPSIRFPTLETPTAGWIYAGRLSSEKGIQGLVDCWPECLSLDVVGTGPLRESLEKRRRNNIRFLGQMASEELRTILPRYRGLVFPSLWDEMAPMIFTEALSAGIPVLALRGNAVADAVESHGTGIVVDSLDEDEIVRAATCIMQNPDLRSHCGNIYRTEYSLESWGDQLLSLFAEVSGRQIQ